MKLCALLVGSVLLANTIAAQESDELSRGPDAGITGSRVHGIDVLPATGRPFSARDCVKRTRNREDGSPYTTYLFATVARDSQGRIYREQRSLVSTNTYREAKLIGIVILDPVAHTRTTCSVKKRHCLISDYHASASFQPPPVGSTDTGYLIRESLGADVIDGVKVVGTRETTSVDPAVNGGSRSVVSTREFWYSPDLQINLSVTRRDPKAGTQAIYVEDLSRSEPDPAMFQIPEGFAFSKRNPPETGN
jgi:hypothetical protein